MDYEGGKMDYEGVDYGPHSPSPYRKQREDEDTVPHSYKTEESHRRGLNSSGKYFTGSSSNNRRRQCRDNNVGD